jgi:hypothetical protein
MNQLSTRYYDLDKIIDPFVIDDIINIVREQLDEGNIKSIIDALYKNTKILGNGIPFIKVQGISRLFRTSNSGLERVLIYNGIPNLLSRSSIVQIDGYDYISGHSFISILDSRMANKRGKTREYLQIAWDLYNKIINSSQIRDLKDIFIEDIEKNRSSLKQKRIETKNITHCEFTNRVINNFTKVQFAHLDSIVYNPYKALDIENGVIIFSEIHADMTRLGIHTYEETYEYCESKGYLVDWA